MVEKANKGFWEFDWEKIWKTFKVPISLGFVGLILIGIGTFSILKFGQKEPEIEIIPAETVESGAAVFIDLQGAVEKPGFYQLPADARINDLLIRAGGLSAEADRGWCEKSLNLAQKLVDGTKLYIPRENEAPSSKSQSAGQVAGVTSATALINLNTASAAELDSLWGIGAKRAQDIIAHRPYQSVEELKTKKVLPGDVFEKNQDKISVY